MAFMPFSYSRSTQVALWWRFGRRSGIGGESPLRGHMPHENVQLLASLLQRLSTSEYNRHRSIHHAISLVLTPLGRYILFLFAVRASLPGKATARGSGLILRACLKSLRQ